MIAILVLLKALPPNAICAHFAQTLAVCNGASRTCLHCIAGMPKNTVQIRNSNSYQLWSQVQRAGAVPQYFGIAPDDMARVFDRFYRVDRPAVGRGGLR